MTRNKGKGATDPQDMVFALLGISTDGCPDSPQPDYCKSVGQIYKETVKNIITREGDLAILSFAGLHENNPEFPSWVVNWAARTSPASTTFLWTLSQEISSSAYGGHVNAAGNAPMSCLSKTISNFCDFTMQCGSNQGSRWVFRFTTLKSNLAVANVNKHHLDDPYLTGESQATAFCQVLNVGTWSPDPVKPLDPNDEGLVRRRACSHRCFAITSSGSMGSGSLENSVR